MPKFRVTREAGAFFRHHGRAYKPGDVVEMSVDTAAGFPRALKLTEHASRLPAPFVPEREKQKSGVGSQEPGDSSQEKKRKKG